MTTGTTPQVIATGRPASVLVYVLGSAAIWLFTLWTVTVGEAPDGPGRLVFAFGAYLMGPAMVIVTARAWFLLRRDPAMIVAVADELHVLDSGWMWPRRTSVHAVEIDQVLALEYWFGRVHGHQLRVTRRKGKALTIISPWTGQPAADLKRSIVAWLDPRGAAE